MTKIYQGAGITEYHLNSGQVITLNEQESNEMLEYNDVAMNDMENGYNLYEECGDMLAKADIDEYPNDFIEGIIDKLKSFQKGIEGIPSIDDILLRLNDEADILQADILDKEDFIKYLLEWIADENI